MIYVLGIGEVVVFCGVLLGVGFGFLWFNVLLVMVFMGDIGLLFFGVVFGFISVVIKYEIVFVIIGGIFVMEVLFVMM